MKHKYCPHCHQPIRHVALDVRMTPRKAQIIGLIKGEEGLGQQQLAHSLGVTPEAVRAHVYQINDMLYLENSPWRIIGGKGNGYRLKKNVALVVLPQVV